MSQQAPSVSQRRALFVTSWFPEIGTWTATAGIARRQQILLDGLKKSGLEVDVVLITTPSQAQRSQGAGQDIAAELRAQWSLTGRVIVCNWQQVLHDSLWQRYIAPALSFRWQTDYRRFTEPAVVQAIENSIDPSTSLILCQRLPCAFPVIAARGRQVPMLFDMDDVEHVVFRRRIAEPPIWRTKFLQHLQVPALKRAERFAIRHAVGTLVCSELDRATLCQLAGTDSVQTVPNAMPVRDAGPPAVEPTLLILGHYSFGPNRVGADYFIEHVWPLVTARVSEARLVVAGADPQLLMSYERAPNGVEFTGYVRDLDDLYRTTRVVVCPIQSGGGTRLKIMEAAAYARPIVSTSIGAEGIELRDGTEIILADGAKAMARACVELLTSSSSSRALGSRARIAIETRYSRDRIVGQLGEFLARHARKSPA